MRRTTALLAGIAVVVVVVDQVSKAVVVATLTDRPPVRLVGGLVQLVLTRNSGAAFSLGAGATLVFTAVALAVVVVIVRTARRLASAGWAVVLGLLLGGAVGNLVDRLVRAPGPGRGRVVDWVELPHWPVFNVADSAITVGVVLALLLSLRGVELDDRRRDPTGTPSGTGGAGSGTPTGTGGTGTPTGTGGVASDTGDREAQER